MMATSLQALKLWVNSVKKPRRLLERAGFSKKSNDLNQIVNYLPAPWVKRFFSLPSLGDPVPESRLNRISATHTSIPIIGDQWVG